MIRYALWVTLLCVAVQGSALAASLSPQQTLDRVLQSDPWGLTGARVNAKLILEDKRGTKETLEFSATSRRHDGNLSKSIIRFKAPAELRGAGFLQVQKRQDDDDRFLFLPEIKRARRVSGKLRATAFMGTDFSYADLDRRDLREGTAAALPDATIAGIACTGLDVKPKTSESQYSHMEIWVRKDNYLPIHMKMYDLSGSLVKTFQTEAMTRVSGQWFIAKSRMTNHVTGHSTRLILDKITVDQKVPDDEFTVQALERL